MQDGRIAEWQDCRILAAIILTVFAAADPQAQSTEAKAQGAFADATFSATFRKYTPPENVFSPFYSWDAFMHLDVTLFRRGRGAINLDSVFQTAGTENLGSKVSVGGTGYLFGVEYSQVISDKVTLSAGLKHFSSHLTRDLDHKEAEARSQGIPIPTVDDPSEYNVFFFGISRRFISSLFKPEIDVLIEPVNFRFAGTSPGYVRPIYVGTRWMLWERPEKAFVAETQHEFGPNWFNVFSVRLDLFRHAQEEGRLQFFMIASPGHDLHVSPNIGGLRDGIAAGVRIRFQAAATAPNSAILPSCHPAIQIPFFTTSSIASVNVSISSSVV